jgi:hypothetical protein
MRTVIVTLCALLLGGWTVTRERDRMTDRELTWASSQSGGATLLVGCLNGRVSPRLMWNERKGWGRGIGVSWRVDNSPVAMTTGGYFSEDGTTLYAWPGTFEGQVMGELRRAKRIRVSLGREMLDFDLSAGVGWPEKWGRC